MRLAVVDLKRRDVGINGPSLPIEAALGRRAKEIRFVEADLLPAVYDKEIGIPMLCSPHA